MASTTERLGKPLPVADEQSEGYWQAAADHVLAIQRCGHCGSYAHPPVLLCAGCLSTRPSFAFEPMSGRGTVKTWTVMRDAFLPGFRDEVPYVLVEVELAEQPGLTLVGRLVDGPEADLALGMRVETVFHDRAPGIAVPEFQLVGGAR